MDYTKRSSLWYHGGVASAAAACFTHPLDLLKVHLQIQAEKLHGMHIAVNIVRREGFFALYNGISASVGRQLTYSLTRFAIYDTLKPVVMKNDNPSLVHKLTLASISGFFGGIVGTPCDVVNVRMQNDIRLEKQLRRNYKHVFDGLYQVVSKEGISTLFNGVGMATARAVLITNGQLACYDQIKEILLRSTWFEDTIVTHFTSSFLAGAIATALTQPVDVMKTRLMNAAPGQYRNAWHCVAETWSQGPLGFFKNISSLRPICENHFINLWYAWPFGLMGFIPSFIRLGPQTILIWIFKEQLRLRFGKDP